jgi:hypothetical protein
MLPATEDEITRVREYMASQAHDLTVLMVQKVYSETILSARHDVWDVHTDVDRWWVITDPMNLYAQDQFPNMDLALTFHVGLCLRIPRSDRNKLSDLPIEPFAECYRSMQEAADALGHADEVADYQAIGVRCRESLLSFASAAQHVLPWTAKEEAPKKADLRAWVNHICSVALPGDSHDQRRALLKSSLESAWKFTNWLTHSKGSKWHDAEAAVAVTESAITLCTSAVILHMRGVPEQCPACGSHRLSPQRGYHSTLPDVEFERPTCDKCGWAGDPVPIADVPKAPAVPAKEPPVGECGIMTSPLRALRRPGRDPRESDPE